MRSSFSIRNVTIFDGLGGAGVLGDIHVSGGVFVTSHAGGEVIDGRGLGVCPGFVDTHTHDDYAVAFGDMAAKVSQGVTTVVTGNCGESLAPLQPGRPIPEPVRFLGPRRAFRYPAFGEYLADLRAVGTPVNVAALVGHATLRAAVMDDLDRDSTPAERAAMHSLLVEAVAAGAFGVSTGLEYEPARAATTQELIDVTRACRGRMYTSHLRDETDGVIDAMTEAFDIGRATGARVVLSHHKCSGRQNFGRSVETLAHFERAVAAGLDVALDVYPYDACSTILDPMFVRSSRRTLITSCAIAEAIGRSLDELSAMWALSEADVIERLQPAGAVYFDMDEADVQRIIAHPASMIGSDGLPMDEHPHPRLWGTFARVLGHYARDLGLLTMGDAIRKMTSLPAAVFGLAGRGRIAAGFAGDLVLFDPMTVIDTATYDDPCRPASGIHRVWVNGEPVWSASGAEVGRPGQVLSP